MEGFLSVNAAALVVQRTPAPTGRHDEKGLQLCTETQHVFLVGALVSNARHFSC